MMCSAQERQTVMSKASDPFIPRQGSAALTGKSKHQAVEHRADTATLRITNANATCKLVIVLIAFRIDMLQNNSNSFTQIHTFCGIPTVYSFDSNSCVCSQCITLFPVEVVCNSYRCVLPWWSSLTSREQVWSTFESSLWPNTKRYTPLPWPRSQSDWRSG